jgi:hypothetical protein
MKYTGVHESDFTTHGTSHRRAQDASVRPLEIECKTIDAIRHHLLRIRIMVINRH